MLINDHQLFEARQKFNSSRDDLWQWCQTNCWPYAEVLVALGQAPTQWDMELNYHQDLSGIEIYSWNLSAWQPPEAPDSGAYEKTSRRYQRRQRRTYVICNEKFWATRSDAVFCRARCRKRAQRQREQTQIWLADLDSTHSKYITWLEKNRQNIYKRLIKIQDTYRAGSAVLDLLSELVTYDNK